MELNCEIGIGESDRASGVVAARWSSGGSLIGGILAGAFSLAAGYGIAFPLGAALDIPAAAVILGPVIAIPLTLGVALPLRRRRLSRLYRRKLAARGVESPLAVRFTLGRRTMRWRIGSVISAAPWSAVSEVLHVGDWWVIIIQTQACYLPRRAFEDAETEAAFVERLREALTEAALARSPALHRSPPLAAPAG